MKKNQNGFLLMEVILALSISMVMLASGVFYQVQGSRKDSAELYGRQIAQYNNAVRASLVSEGPAILAAGAVKLDVNWLHDAACPAGTAAQPYLDCSFGPAIANGVDISAWPAANRTTITTNGLAPNPSFAGITIFPGVTIGGNDRPDLSGIAVNAASRHDAYESTRSSSLGGGTISYNLFINAGNFVDPATGANIAIPANSIVAAAIADSGADIFLRRNGSNNMTGALDMNGNMIANAGNITANAITGSNIHSTGDMTVDGNGFFNNNIGVTGDAIINGNTTMANMQVNGQSDMRGNIVNTATGNVTVSSNLLVFGDSSVSGNSNITGNENVNGNLNLSNAGATHTIQGVVNTNDIRISGISLEGAPASVARSIGLSGIYNDSDVIIKPNCNVGGLGLSPQIFVTPSIFHASGDPLFGVVGYATDNGGSWTIHVETMDSGSNMVPGGKASVFVKCS